MGFNRLNKGEIIMRHVFYKFYKDKFISMYEHYKSKSPLIDEQQFDELIAEISAEMPKEEGGETLAYALDYSDTV